MIEGRDSKGHFIKGNVPWNKRADSSPPTIGGKMLFGGGAVKTNRVRVTCPACGEQVEAVARDGQVKGYCAVAKQYVDFLIETQGVRTDNDSTAEVRSKISAALKKLWQDPEYRAKQSTTKMGKHLTDETKAKISMAQITAEGRAKLSAASKKLWQDPEYRAKQIVNHTGKHITTEHRAKISVALKTAKARAKLSASHTGKHPTAETKAKISAALKRRYNAGRGV